LKILQHKIPDTWQWIEISQIGNIETGTTPSKKDKSNYGVDFPFYKPTELEAGINVRESRERLSKKGIKKARLLPKNSILVTCIGATIGKTGIIRNEGASNQQINSIIPVGSINPDFVYYQVICPFFQNQIIKRSSSTTLPILNKSRFSKLLFALPSQNEQDRIVKKIEELFSDLDKTIEDLKKTQEQLKIYRQAVLKAAFEGKLTEKWRVQNSIELLFEEVLLKDITDIIMGQSPPSSTYNTNKVGLPFYQGKKEFGDLFPTPEKYCSEPKKIAESNDILISVRAPVGPTNICKEKSCIGRGLAAIRTKEKIKKYYLFYYLKYFVFNLIEKSTGTTFNAISKDTLEGFKVSLFSLLEQQQIIQEIKSRLSVCDKVEKTVEQNLSKIEYLRQSILKKAFEGKLVSQDPNDLPACELLKQIKIKKDKMSKNGK
jgi:type I restriction enzyme S subunit